VLYRPGPPSPSLVTGGKGDIVQTIDLRHAEELEEEQPGDDEVVDEEIRRLYRSYGWIVVVVMTLVLVEAARLIGSLLG
jgi:hypothetical protein